MLFDENMTLVRNDRVGPRLYLFTAQAPQIAQAVEPGQFIHMTVPGLEAHILRRPFSVYAADPQAGTIDVLYQVVGVGSDFMTGLPVGTKASAIGPVGHGWTVPEDAQRLLLVGGGVGAAPLFMLTQQMVAEGRQVHVVLGAATKDALVCKDRYQQALGVEPACATDDGTYGRPGFCTSLVDEAIAAAAQAGEPYDYLAVCGPTPLMRIVSKAGMDAGINTQVSMEKRMACGIGACLSCVVETVDGKRRSCVDGPVFQAKDVVW